MDQLFEVSAKLIIASSLEKKTRILNATKPAVALPFSPNWFSLAKMQNSLKSQSGHKHGYRGLREEPASPDAMVDRLGREHRTTASPIFSPLSPLIPRPAISLMAMLAGAVAVQWSLQEPQLQGRRASSDKWSTDPTRMG